MRDSTHTLVSLPLANMAWPFQRTGAACVYLILSGRPLLTPRFSRPAFASIEGDGERIFVAVIDVKRAVIAVVPAAYRPDATRVPELWLIPPGGKPLALGVLPSDRPTQIAIPATFADQARPRCRPSRLARTSRRFAHRPADRPGHWQREAHEPVSAATHP